MEYISKGKWYWKEFPGSSVKWTCGQPLGLYPSFAAFALFHGAVLNALRLTKGGDFFIIGDDVVIRGQLLAEAYELALGDLGIPISEAKTLREAVIAEFGGKIITQDSVIESLSWSYYEENIIDLGRRFGRNILPYMDKEAAKLLKAFGDLPYPFGCDWFSSTPYEQKIYLCECLSKEHSIDGDSPEVQFRMKILNEISEPLLDFSNSTLDLIIENQDRRLGFSWSRLSRDTCDKVFADKRITSLCEKKNKNILFLQRRWLKSLYPIITALDSTRKQE
jgi:hypothetical protein